MTPRPQAPVRHEVERRTAVWLVYLHRLPRMAVAAVAAALLLAGLLAPGPAGGIALLVLGAALAVLAFITWPTVRPSGRLMRVLVIAAVLVSGLAKLLG